MSFDQEKHAYTKARENSVFATVRLPSGAKRLINSSAQATLGVVAPSASFNVNFKKAGRTR